MEQLTDLKAILHSKRANIYYLEKCRVMQKDGRVLYLTEAKDENQYWNIPIANTPCCWEGTSLLGLLCSNSFSKMKVAKKASRFLQEVSLASAICTQSADKGTA